MKIVIAGAGKVGFELARSLSSEHDVTVIDKNSEALDRLGELIDVYPLVGDIENPRTYEALLDSQVDIFIAVTDSDEANILSVLLAGDTIEIGRKIIRLRNSYFEDSKFLASLGDMERIFPYRLVAETIRQLLRYPTAHNVKNFSNTHTKLISMQIDNPLYEAKKVSEIEKDRLKIVGIERGERFFIPAPQIQIEHGDRVYFLGDGELLSSIYGQLDLQMPSTIKNAVVFGADDLGIEVAKVFIEEEIGVKIVDKDISKCHFASDIFQDKALVINSRYDEDILYAEERLDQADMVIATDRKDETNIIRALQARKHNIPKVVAVNNERKYYLLMHQLGLIVARGPQINAYYSILETLEQNESVELRHFCGGEGVILSRYIYDNPSIIGRKPKRWYEDGMVLIDRNGELILSDNEVLQEGDVVFLITDAENEKRGYEWIRFL